MQVEAYVIFTLKSGANAEAVIDKLRMSLGMCLQLFVAGNGPDLIYHLECTEESGKKNLDTAVAQLSAVEGIERTTVAQMKR